jgi:glucosamine-6-phosphate deaminase
MFISEDRAPLRKFPIGPLQVEIYQQAHTAGKAGARLIAAALRHAIANNGRASIVFAAAPSQNDILNALVHSDDIDWHKVTAFHLDEYIGLPETHPASFRRYLREHILDYIQPHAFYFLQGDSDDPLGECRRYANLLDVEGFDAACIGIGENGHLAFNDPPADFTAPNAVNVVNLDEACRRQQVNEGHFPTLQSVPTQALSLSIPAILSARTIACSVSQERKAEAVYATLMGPISGLCPASILRTHPNTTLYLDEDAAALLAD